MYYSDSMGLKVLIVGAGPVGLAAAIALARASPAHQVDLYEKSTFSREIGAALHFCPQAVRVLQGWGIDVEKEMRGCRLSVWNHYYDLRAGGRPHYRKLVGQLSLQDSRMLSGSRTGQR